jgi:hypothetical protein
MKRLTIFSSALLAVACNSMQIPNGEDPTVASECRPLSPVNGQCSPIVPPPPNTFDEGGDFELLSPGGDPIPLADSNTRMVFPWMELPFSGITNGTGFMFRVRSSAHSPDLTSCIFYTVNVRYGPVMETLVTQSVGSSAPEAAPLSAFVGEVPITSEDGLDVQLEVIQWEGTVGHIRVASLHLVDPCEASE